ncbi:hypothetical protein DXG01_004649 [Tephrocybe rancida]|nr:hypothetical protein DXG01_004649 [Tephrocybe rancida]
MCERDLIYLNPPGAAMEEPLIMEIDISRTVRMVQATAPLMTIQVSVEVVVDILDALVEVLLDEEDPLAADPLAVGLLVVGLLVEDPLGMDLLVVGPLEVMDSLEVGPMTGLIIMPPNSVRMTIGN